MRSRNFELDAAIETKRFDLKSFSAWVDSSRADEQLDGVIAECLDTNRPAELSALVLRTHLRRCIPPDFKWVLEMDGSGTRFAVRYTWTGQAVIIERTCSDSDLSILLMLLEQTDWQEERRESFLAAQALTVAALQAQHAKDAARFSAVPHPSAASKLEAKQAEAVGRTAHEKAGQTPLKSLR